MKGTVKMKKSKLSVGLVASFIGALALTSCGDTSRLKEPTADGELVQFVDYNGDKKIVIGANDLYGKYSDSKDGTRKVAHQICCKRWSREQKRWSCCFEQCDRKKSCLASLE